MSFQLDSRVDLKPHLRAVVLDGAHVMVVADGSTILLRGKVYALLIPKLARRLPVGEIVSALMDRAPAEQLFFALEQLWAHGILGEVVDSETPADRYWGLLGTDRAKAEERLRAISISVQALGLDDKLRETATTMLRTAGLRVVDGDEASLTLVMVDDYLNPALAELNASFRERLRSWLILKPVGDRIWIGPMFRSEGPCWNCLRERLWENRHGQHGVNMGDIRRWLVPPATVPVVEQAVLNLLGAVLVRAFGMGGEPPFASELVTFDLASLATDRHRVLTDPGCPVCHPNHEPSSSIQPAADVERATARVRVDGGYRVCEASETFDRLLPLVSPITGIVPRVHKASHSGRSHIFYARHGTRLAGGALGENRVLGKPSWACGKGATEIQARVSCVAEAVERYSIGFFGTELRRAARWGELEGAIHPNAILNFSAEQFRNRAQWNERLQGFNWIPMPFDEARVIDWSPARSLQTDIVRWLPTALCYLNYPLPEEHRFCQADASGCAAGNTHAEAILQALLELVERDAAAIWWYNRIRRPAIDLRGFGISHFDGLAAEFNERGRTLELLDITTDLGIPACAAVSWDSSGGRAYLGFGAHLDPKIAASRALNEVSQLAAYHEENAVSSDPLVNWWMNNVNCDNAPYLIPADGERIYPTRIPSDATGEMATDVRACVDRLARSGIDVLVCDMTRSNVGFPVVRVVAPGLRHFWARFGTGRLYDVPVQLGWISSPTREDALNPVPFML
jgi:ribosomal protein S12 methylthiotransferase accessory factor